MRNVARFALATVAITALILAVGCKGLESKIVGKYKGQIKMPTAAANDQQAQMAAKMAEAFASNLSLELKDDKTFTLNMMMAIDGKWALDGTTLTLTADKVGGQPVNAGKTGSSNEPMKFSVSSDGTTLTAITNASADKGSMTFTKQ